MKIYSNIFNQIICPENLFRAWDEFKAEKRNKLDVQKFERKLEENIFQLHRELKSKRYKHGAYKAFYIQDPKQRHIHKATVRDRVLHHALFLHLNNIFEPTFISDSFSCRNDKGTHKGVKRLRKFLLQASKNNKKPCYVLKCDIKKFFDTIDHRTLFWLIQKRVKDDNALWLIWEIINSFASGASNLFERKGVPIGNLTSQLFANIYLNQLDQYIKHQLKVRHYIRYTDDFVIVHTDPDYLQTLANNVGYFLEKNLKLSLHPQKIIIRKYIRGIDFLGYISLPYHALLRTKTKRRMLRKIRQKVGLLKNDEISELTFNQSLQSYFGILQHCDSYKFQENLKNQIHFWLTE